jgi:hypothetical protein
MIIYVVDPIKRTTEPKGWASGTASEREKGDTGEESRRATEYRIKIKYPLTVWSAPLVLALPLVVLRTE